jgi:hypothetical protein
LTEFKDGEQLSEKRHQEIKNNNNEDYLRRQVLIEDFLLLRPIFQFARSHNISDCLVAEMFTLSIQENEINEEKFQLIADGATVSHLK